MEKVEIDTDRYWELYDEWFIEKFHRIADS